MMLAAKTNRVEMIFMDGLLIKEEEPESEVGAEVVGAGVEAAVME